MTTSVAARFVLSLAVAVSAAACLPRSDRADAPAVDHHMHLQSTRASGVLVRLKEKAGDKVEPEDRAVVAAADAVAALDAAGVRKGVVLSAAYLLGSPDLVLEPEVEAVREENDWTAEQVRPYASRLVGFCSVNPLKEYADDEVERCARIGLRGLKLHFANSAVDLRSPDHLERLEAVLRRANDSRLPLLVHLRTRAKDYGEPDGAAFVAQLLPAAPDVPVTLAHMGGWGGYDRATDAALGAVLQACQATPAVCRQLRFELAFAVMPASAATAPKGTSLRALADAQSDFPDANLRLASRIRAVGAERVLFGSDWPGMTPRDELDAIRKRLPLAANDLRTILVNEAPYAR